MANIVKILWSKLAGNTPANLFDGQIAINQKDKKLFYPDENNVIQSFDLLAGSYTPTQINVNSTQNIDNGTIVRADTFSGSITLTLTNPNSALVTTIKKVDSSENSVYIYSSNLIDGDTIAELSTEGESITLKWTGSTYDII